MPVYLDYNATAPVHPEVIRVMAEAMGVPSNPSSVHAYGRAAKKAVEDARMSIAHHISAFPHELMFVSSGTEANTMALKSVDRPIIISAIEHASVLKTAGENALAVPVNRDGVIELDALESVLKGSAPALVSVMLANNETGVIQPIAEISRMAREYGAIVHCDAVQAIGKMPVDMGMLGVDMLTLSAHKCGGPQGIAVLAAKEGIHLPRFFIGGGQELGRRAGTEHVAAIAGFAKILEWSKIQDWQKPIRAALDGMEATILEKVPGSAVLGRNAPRLPNTSSLLMPNLPAETQLMRFDLEGFAISAGSACSSGRIEPSHVVRAMQVSGERQDRVIRVSAGWNTTAEDIDAFTQSWLKLAMRF